MKVLHVSPSFYPAGQYGGPIRSGYGLCNGLANTPEIELRVLTTDSDGPNRIDFKDTPTRLPAGYDIYYCRRWFGADIAPGLFGRLYTLINWADIVHLTAVYSPPTIPTLLLCKLLKKPVVWSPRGALQRWEGSTRTRVKRVWESVCNSLCKPDRVVLHSTSEAESLESAARIPRAQTAVIPNGIELPKLNGHKKGSDALQLLYLGRLHPIKGIEKLLHSLALLKATARLSICGDGESGYQAHLHSLVRDLGLDGRVDFHGRVDGDAKEQQFRDADLCVVPSFKENFCVVVAEALAREVPVIASRGTPWQRVEEMECGLWVDNDSETLSEAIDLAAHMPLGEMGKRGREWMEREFSWRTVAERMVEQYRTLVEANVTNESPHNHNRKAA